MQDSLGSSAPFCPCGPRTVFPWNQSPPLWLLTVHKTMKPNMQPSNRSRTTCAGFFWLDVLSSRSLQLPYTTHIQHLQTHGTFSRMWSNVNNTHIISTLCNQGRNHPASSAEPDFPIFRKKTDSSSRKSGDKVSVGRDVRPCPPCSQPICPR